MPNRIQLKRSKGWRLPPDAVSVARPGPFGNPFSVIPTQKPGTFTGGGYIAVPTLEDAIDCYRLWLIENPDGQKIAERAKAELRGKHLGCWCKEGEPCHADVLLQVANS